MIFGNILEVCSDLIAGICGSRGAADPQLDKYLFHSSISFS